MRATKTGFTLMELLVVVAIISVLAAMLLPSLAEALELAVNANLRIGQGPIGGSYRGCLPGQTADDIFRFLGYRRSEIFYSATPPY